ncbi:integrase [Sinorhizobium medicae]
MAEKKAEPGTHWNDPKVPGLRLRHLNTKSVYYLYYRTRAGRQRNMKLGDERLFTLTRAREEAKEILARVAKGEDPAATRSELSERPTMATLKEWHLERHADAKNKPVWRRDIESMYRMHILPHFGEKTAVADVTEADVNALHHKLRKQPHRANRVCAVLSKGFNLAEKWGWRPRRSNPVIIEKYKEKKRSRQPAADEAARLLIALDKSRAEEPHFVGLIELLLFTGARLNEVMAAKWDWVKEDGLHLPDSKTGEKILPLSSLARDVLAEIPQVKGNPHIIVGRRKGKHMVNVTKPWGRLMKSANITERLIRHDLRRFFASAGLSGGGVSLSQVGELLGHMDPRTTKRYASLLTNTAQEAADATALAVKHIMTGGGKVVAMTMPNDQ